MMLSNIFHVVVFDPLKASDEMINQFFDIDDEWEIEKDPDEPLFPREIHKKFLLDPHPHNKRYRWLVYSVEEIDRVVGYGSLDIHLEKSPSYEDNKHLGFFKIFVSKDFRGKKIGSKILRIILDKTKELKRISTLQSGTPLDTGQKFITHYEGSIAIESAENRLYFKAIDWDLMSEWRKAGAKLAKKEGITLVDFFDCPEEIIEEYMYIYTETFNQQPYGELEGRPKFTPQTRRLDEKRFREKGMEWYTIITQEKDKTISGLTEYYFYAQVPHRLEQGLTGVKEKYRGRGLGKWLKAEMIFHIKKKYPNLKFIGTFNAPENAPMLAINERMGFKEHIANKLYKFELEKLDKLV